VICSDPATRALSKAIMLASQAIAEKFGVKFRVDVEQRIEGARKVGAHKTSMLQDLERGRPMEIDPLVSGNEAIDANHHPSARCRAGSCRPTRRCGGAVQPRSSSRGENAGLCLIAPLARQPRGHRHFAVAAASCLPKTEADQGILSSP
jgi:hypothetical protein